MTVMSQGEKTVEEAGAAQVKSEAAPEAKPSRAPAPTPTYEGDFVLDEHFMLECGRTLSGLTLHYAV